MVAAGVMAAMVAVMAVMAVVPDAGKTKGNTGVNWIWININGCGGVDHGCGRTSYIRWGDCDSSALLGLIRNHH